VPFTLHVEDKEKFAVLSGLALAATISNARQSFTENLLFTCCACNICCCKSRPGNKFISSSSPSCQYEDICKATGPLNPRWVNSRFSVKLWDN
jgi:hypothetical protein